MKLVKGNCFEMNLENDFDGIITDIPYKGSIKGKLNEQNFEFNKFFNLVNRITKSNSFLISFCNMKCLMDFNNFGKKYNWKFHTYQIWNKEPVRNWISWTFPLRTCEFIIYMIKGKFKFSFKNGLIKESYKRSSFGGKLKNTKSNTKKVSYGMYSEICTIPIVRKNKTHLTEKPIEFSDMFLNIVGKNVKIIDLFCGTGNLIKKFKNSLGIDLIDYWNKK